MKKSIRLRWIMAYLILSTFILAPVIAQAGEKKKDKEDIVVSTPKPHQEVCSPLTVKGKAKSPWFFEAVFPIRLLDAKCQELASGKANAIGDWTSGDFVPFEGKLEFTVTKPTKALLVLQNDNPSGLPENTKKKEIPITLLPAKK
jgi:Immunoglobulin-like domain of bacterial spore germination